MLAAIGVESIDDLFAEIPEGCAWVGRSTFRRQARAGGLLPTCATSRAQRLAEDEISFLGAGMYDHYVPALIDSILSARSS
jgi:glycine dehydrogenase subunit 1